MQGQFLIIGSAVVIALVIIIVILYFVRKYETKYYRDKIKNFEVERNTIASTPILLELSKVEPIIKNEKMEEKYGKWQEEFNTIKEKRLALIDDMLIDLDIFVDKRDYKSCTYSMAKIEMEIYKVKEEADNLLEEIQDVTLSEEKYRAIVTKLKAKYRKLSQDFEEHKELYGEIKDSIALQFENIEHRFLDFEKVMEDNEYSEVVHIVKALDTMIEHIEIIVNEVPDVLLMAKEIIPKRIKEVKSNYDELIKLEFPLDYLKFDYNIDEINKNILSILDKVNVLNLEGCMFDLKTMLEYLDSLFIDFDKERLARKVYEENNSSFVAKLEKINKLVKDVYLQLDDIKSLYDLNDDDVEIINTVNGDLIKINDDYRELLEKVGNRKTPYTVIHKELEELIDRLAELENNLDKSLKSLGNMYEDEVRAREQLEEIQDFLKQCKNNMRSYKLPVITDNYFVQLAEANEAIKEVVKELEKKPIVIKTLNIRVDTARDLVLKLYNTTNDMIRMAKSCEVVMVYGNRYRNYPEVDAGLDDALNKFFVGDYKRALDIAVRTISLVDDGIAKKFFSADSF